MIDSNYKLSEGEKWGTKFKKMESRGPENNNRINGDGHMPGSIVRLLLGCSSGLSHASALPSFCALKPKKP